MAPKSQKGISGLCAAWYGLAWLTNSWVTGVEVIVRGLV